MATRLTYLVLAFGTVGLSVLAYAQDTSTGVLKLPQDIEFKSPLTSSPQTVVLYGDPTKPGVFVLARQVLGRLEGPGVPTSLLLRADEVIE
jgi:hypothetical protein